MTSTYDDQAGKVRELAAAFSAAIAEHLRSVESRRGESDAAVFAAYDRLRDSFIAYEDALYETYDEVTPFEVVEMDEDDFTDDEDDEADEADEEDDEENLDEDEDEFDEDLDAPGLAGDGDDDEVERLDDDGFDRERPGRNGAGR